MSNNGQDSVVGKVTRGTKLQAEKDGKGEIVWREVPGKFFTINLFETDCNGEPKITGEYVNAKGEKLPKHNINRVLRVAESSFLKVATGEARSCNVYWSKQ